MVSRLPALPRLLLLDHRPLAMVRSATGRLPLGTERLLRATVPSPSGQKRQESVTDYQTACAFCVRHPQDRSQRFAASQTRRRDFRMRTVGLG